MYREGVELIELIYAGALYILLALLLFYRLYKGPYSADRVVAGDSIDMLVTSSMILFSLFTGRGIYLDIAVITAIIGFLSTVMYSRYLEGRL